MASGDIASQQRQRDGRADLPDRSHLAEALWILAPFAFFILVLQWLWFNAPVWDDYDTILGLLLRADEIHTPREWLAMVFGQHNEHRIAVTRLVTLAMARSMGEVDFRLLMLIGNLALLGTFAFIWREFRGIVPTAIIGAAAILMFQWSYYEASLMASASLPHLGVVFFAFGCLFFAMRDGAAGAALAAAFGVLAAASQANGLLALPIAAVTCAVLGRKWRAVLLGVLALLAWVLYFRGYVRPSHHPSPLVAFSNPVATVHLFFVVVGGILPGTKASAILGTLIFAGFAWVTRRGFWREHPAAALWVAFLLATAAAAAVGRVGLGVGWASRYAIGSTCLLVILGLAVHALTKPQGRKPTILAVLGATGLSLAVSLALWPWISDSAGKGHLLREAVPAVAGLPVDRFGGAYYPDPARAIVVLTRAAARGYYFPPKQKVYPMRVVSAKSMPTQARTFGHIDGVAVSGTKVSLTGWTDITALLPSRTMHIISPAPFREAGPVAVVARQDVAFALHDEKVLFSGFRLELDYSSESEARNSATAICVVVEAPGVPATLLNGPHPGCGAR